jgi:uncharacterized protein (TIGR04222 family)
MGQTFAIITFFGVTFIGVAFWLMTFWVWDSIVRQPEENGAIPILDSLQLGGLARGNEGVIETALAMLGVKEFLDFEADYPYLINPETVPAGLSNVERQLFRMLRQGKRIQDLYKTPTICEPVILPMRTIRLLPSKECKLVWSYSGLAASYGILITLAACFLLFILFAFKMPPELATFGWFLFATGVSLFCLGIIGLVLSPRVDRTRWGDCVLIYYKESCDPKDLVLSMALYGHSKMYKTKLDALGSICDKYYRDHVWE